MQFAPQCYLGTPSQIWVLCGSRELYWVLDVKHVLRGTLWGTMQSLGCCAESGVLCRVWGSVQGLGCCAGSGVLCRVCLLCVRKDVGSICLTPAGRLHTFPGSQGALRWVASVTERHATGITAALMFLRPFPDHRRSQVKDLNVTLPGVSQTGSKVLQAR